MADVGEMYLVHTMLRREFGLLPDLIRGAGRNDAKRRALIGAHAQLVLQILHTHHESEDLVLWPLLLERAEAKATKIVAAWRNNITPSRLRTTKRSIGSVTGAGSAAMAKDSQRCSMISY
jgi:hypothetical protein